MLNFELTGKICESIKSGKNDDALKLFYDPNYEVVSSHYYDVMKKQFSDEKDVGVFIQSWDVHNIADLDKIVGSVASSDTNIFDKRIFLKSILYSDKVTAFNEDLFGVVEDIFEKDEMARFKKYLAERNDKMDTIVFSLECCEEDGYAVYPVESSIFLNKTYSKKRF